MPAGISKLTRSSAGILVPVGEDEILESDGTGEPRPQPAEGGLRLRRRFSTEAASPIAAPALLVVLNQARQPDERLGHAHAQHHEGEQRADRVAGIVRQGEIGANQEDAERHQALDRIDQGLRPVRQPPESQARLPRFRDAVVPQGLALRLERERLDGLDAEDGLAEHRGLFRLRDDHLGESAPQRAQIGEQDQHDRGPNKPAPARRAKHSDRRETAATRRASSYRGKSRISFPVRNSRTLETCAILCMVSPAGWRSKKSSGSRSRRSKT